MTGQTLDLGLKDKVVVVTGAARGIGREICLALARVGAHVVGVDRVVGDDTATRDGEGLALTGVLAGQEAASWREVDFDLASPEAVRKGCDRILGIHDRVDALVNNAALYGGLEMTPLEALDLDEWDRVMAVNVRGSYLMVRHLLPGLKEAAGRVVNIASVSALRGSPFLLHYVASKGAVIGMTRAMATELGPAGIAVNALAPGLADTPSSRGLGEQYSMVLKRTVAAQALAGALQAQDVVGAVLFLASPLASAITGQTLNVDRGLTRS